MFRFFLRSIPIAFLRFIAILTLILCVENFEVSPLPAWTLLAFAYLMHALLTFLFAWWVFARRVPQTKDAILVSAVFILLEAFFEAWLYLFLTRTTWSNILRAYSWQSLYLVALYALAVFAAAYHVRRKNIKAALPEGMEA